MTTGKSDTPLTHLSILIPSYADWKPAFALDLINAILAFQRTPGFTVSLHASLSTYLPQARETLLGHARAKKADYLLYLDTDMRFPQDTIQRLLERDQDIVGVNYVSRRPPHFFTAARDGKAVPLTKDSTGLLEVDSLGFGVILLKSKVINYAVPQFETNWIKQGDIYALEGEDIFFCRQIRNNGFKIMIDQDLSKQVSHIGEIELNIKTI